MEQLQVSPLITSPLETINPREQFFNEVKKNADSGEYDFLVTFLDGRTEKKRLFIGDKLQIICEFKKRSARRGFPFVLDFVADIKSIPKTKFADLPLSEKLDIAVKYYQSKRNFFLKHAHQDLWKNLWEGFTPDRSKELREALERNWMEVSEKGKWRSYSYFDVKHELGLTYFENNRSNVLDVSKYLDVDVSRIERALQDRIDYTARSRDSYDYSMEYNAEKQMAWFSAEFKGCGNGHYYLMISPKAAMFYESD